MKTQIHENKECKLQQFSKNSITKLALILLSAGSLSAQDKKMSTSISVNMNSGSSSSEGVSKNFGLNPNIGANLFWGNIGAGLDVGTFNSNPEFDFAGYAQQSLGTVKRVMIPTDRETSRSTYFLVGPQYAIRKGKMNIILSTKAGVTMNKMAEFQVEDEASSKVLASYKAPEDFVRNAFTIKPSLSIGYDLTKSFSLTANAQFIKQTGQQDFTTTYRDLSNVQTIDLKGNPLRQPEITKNIVNAPVISSSTKGASEFMSFGLGLTYTIRATGKHYKEATLSMADKKEDNTGTQTTEVNVIKNTDIENKPQDIVVKSNASNIEYAYKPQKADGSVASPNSGNGNTTATVAMTKASDFENKPQKAAVKSNDGNIEYSYKPQKDDVTVANTNSQNQAIQNTVQSEYIKLKLSDDKSKSSKASGNLSFIGRGTKPDGSNDSSPVPVKPSIKNDGKRVIIGGASAGAYAATGLAVQPSNNHPQVIERGTKPDGSNDSSPVPVKPLIKKGWDGILKGSGTATDFETTAGIAEGTPIKGLIIKGGKNPGGSINPDAGNENTSESTKSKQSEAKGNLKAMNGSGEAAKTAGWKIPENEKVIMNPGSGSGNESTSESTKSKQSEAKGNLKAIKKGKTREASGNLKTVKPKEKPLSAGWDIPQNKKV